MAVFVWFKMCSMLFKLMISSRLTIWYIGKLIDFSPNIMIYCLKAFVQLVGRLFLLYTETLLSSFSVVAGTFLLWVLFVVAGTFCCFGYFLLLWVLFCYCGYFLLLWVLSVVRLRVWCCQKIYSWINKQMKIVTSHLHHTIP